ncbi:accessory gland protein Acp53Ea [Drosophila eugracilis]|uniref:accessory gland protein Acp53Ea n=1 Tax=Drosophila eugracilis TaxID=29029 RepID=UPI0007E8316F|nr:accessory gland protein Acp53Ea [Drosophila eugracilis]
MKLITIGLVFTLLAVVFVDQTNADVSKWEEWLVCARIGSKAIGSLVRESIPAARNLINCLDFTRPDNLGDGYLPRLKVFYEFLKIGAFKKSNCLLVPMKVTVKLLRPFIFALETNNCLVA